ncbi:MAG TPA: NUDIX hydrolase [Flavihumibacter sp.]|nr:NUDIX hydrolase [Flavihumibacter sp.]HQD10893.1 NUDIX hydrolase [Flavihumibacter sp.]
MSEQPLKWDILSSEYISNHVYFTARRDRCRRQDGVIVDPYFVVELPTSATAVALTAEGKVLMTRQYRHPIGQVLLETPGGFIDPGEDFATGMRRELMEETGYAFPQVEYLGRVAGNPGVLTGFTELYLATGGVKTGRQQLDHNEEIEVVEIPLNELLQMLINNQIVQSLHANCIFYALLKLGLLQPHPSGTTRRVPPVG